MHNAIFVSQITRKILTNGVSLQPLEHKPVLRLHSARSQPGPSSAPLGQSGLPSQTSVILMHLSDTPGHCHSCPLHLLQKWFLLKPGCSRTPGSLQIKIYKPKRRWATSVPGVFVTSITTIISSIADVSLKNTMTIVTFEVTLLAVDCSATGWFV